MDTRTPPVHPRTREPQYQFEVDMALRNGIARLGIMSNQRWRDDPRGLLFILARYKFVAKMLSGKNRVVEIGCADAFGTRVVQQEVRSVTASDFDPVFIADARSRMAAEGWQCETVVHDILSGPVPGRAAAGRSGRSAPPWLIAPITMSGTARPSKSTSSAPVRSAS